MTRRVPLPDVTAVSHGEPWSTRPALLAPAPPLYELCYALGHASVATTRVYLGRVGAHEAVDAMRAGGWDPAGSG